MKLLKLVPDNTNIKFLKLRIPFFVLSLVLILGSWTAVAVNGLNFGVDFAGGQEVRMTFQQREQALARGGQIQRRLLNGFQNISTTKCLGIGKTINEIHN